MFPVCFHHFIKSKYTLQREQNDLDDNEFGDILRWEQWWGWWKFILYLGWTGFQICGWTDFSKHFFVSHLFAAVNLCQPYWIRQLSSYKRFFQSFNCLISNSQSSILGTTKKFKTWSWKPLWHHIPFYWQVIFPKKKIPYKRDWWLKITIPAKIHIFTIICIQFLTCFIKGMVLPARHCP